MNVKLLLKNDAIGGESGEGGRGLRSGSSQVEVERQGAANRSLRRPTGANRQLVPRARPLWYPGDFACHVSMEPTFETCLNAY